MITYFHFCFTQHPNFLDDSYNLEKHDFHSKYRCTDNFLNVHMVMWAKFKYKKYGDIHSYIHTHNCWCHSRYGPEGKEEKEKMYK